MKVERLRKAFQVVIMQSDGFDAKSLADASRHVQYNVAIKPWSELHDIFEHAPKMCLSYWDHDRPDIEKVIHQMHERLPHTHLVILTPQQDLKEAFQRFEGVAYDCLPYPLVTPLQLVRCLDRATERDFFRYQDQNLLPQTTESYYQELLQTYSLEQVVEVTLKRLRLERPDDQIVFFKYFVNRRSLVYAGGLDDENYYGVGLSLNELSGSFQAEDLRQPDRIPEFVQMAEQAFRKSFFVSELIEGSEGLVGLFVFFSDSQIVLSGDIKLVLQQARDRLELLELRRRIHLYSTRDITTEVYHRQSFIDFVQQEIARARRVQLPVSLVRLKVDDLPRGSDESDLILKMLAKIFRRHSRVNDIVGRTAVDEFGLLLPHTPTQGAAIKAERLRRIVESADFSKLFKNVANITVSAGVSEYPSLCRDADELLSSSDSALFELTKEYKNRVCMASVPDGFISDFIVPEPEWLKEKR